MKRLITFALLALLALPAMGQTTRRWIICTMVGDGQTKQTAYRPIIDDLLPATTRWSMLNATFNDQWVLVRAESSDFSALEGVSGVFVLDLDILDQLYADLPGRVRAQVRRALDDFGIDRSFLNTPGLTVRDIIRELGNRIQPGFDESEMGEDVAQQASFRKGEFVHAPWYDWQIPAYAQSGTLFTDDFSSDGEGTTWSEAGSQWSVSGGEMTFTGGDGAIETTTSAHATTADVKVSVDVATSPGNFDGGPGCRFTNVSVDNETGYYMDAYETDTVEVYEVTAGNSVKLGSSGTNDVADTDTLRFECEGTALRAYVNDSLEVSTTDSTLTTGRTGLYSWVNTTQFDNFQVDDFVAAGARRVIVISEARQ